MQNKGRDMKFDFSGQVALVTGATRGIGKQIADDFAKLGAEVLLTGTDKSTIDLLNKESRAKRLKKRYFCVDFTNPRSTQSFFKEIGQFPKIDICVNNAGINNLDFLEDSKDKDWDNIVSINLKAPYLLMRVIAKGMKKRGYGRIINMASILSVVSRPKRSIYSATKFGIVGLTVATSTELAPYGVLVNAVSPGFILTDLTRKNLTDKERKEVVSQIPVGRLGQPSDVSNVVLFLSSQLNTYITGKNIVVDGGFIDG